VRIIIPNFYKSELISLFMFKANELGHIILAIVVFGIAVSLESYFYGDVSGPMLLVWGILSAAIVILLNIFTKKVVAYVLDAEVESKTWTWQRFGFYERSYFKKAVPLGFLLPLFLSLLTLGYVKFLALLEYDVYASKSRASKKIGHFRFSEMTETHIAAIGGFGILANLVLMGVAYVLGFSDLARFSAYYAFANVLPLSNLDGVKIFFGSRIAWYLLAAISTIALVLSLVTV
jgi:Zn-dependent protease